MILICRTVHLPLYSRQSSQLKLLLLLRERSRSKTTKLVCWNSVYTFFLIQRAICCHSFPISIWHHPGSISFSWNIIQSKKKDFNSLNLNGFYWLLISNTNTHLKFKFSIKYHRHACLHYLMTGTEKKKATMSFLQFII